MRPPRPPHPHFNYNDISNKHSCGDGNKGLFNYCEGDGPPASSAGDLENASVKSTQPWGGRSGTEDDRIGLDEIISTELMKTGNPGDCCWLSESVNLMNLKVWTLSLLMRLAKNFVRTMRPGKEIIPVRPPSNRWIIPIRTNSNSKSDSSVGEELEFASWRQGNTEGPCWCHHEKRTVTSH